MLWFLQAAILCLFQDEIDYATAFKCASETNSCDALDEYYDYIWDINLLEFLIYWHTKLNHQEHRQKLVSIYTFVYIICVFIKFKGLHQ